MNKQLVERRLDIVDGSAGSVVAVASWCALHASNSPLIMACISEKLVGESTSDESRCALLYVIHEMLLTCAMRGVPETGKRAILLAVSKTLPAALRAVFERDGSSDSTFAVGLKKVVAWWTILNILPREWIESLPGPRTAPSTGAEPAPPALSDVPSELRHILQLMKRFNDEKEKLKRAKESGSPSTVEETHREALRQLVRVRKAVTGRASDGGTDAADDEHGGPSTGTLLGLLDAEQMLLMGEVDSGPAHDDGDDSDRVDMDVLGSFFS